jgi:hypothetical protein
VALAVATALTDVDACDWTRDEETLTAERVQPVVVSIIESLSIDGITVAGDGRPRSAPSVSWSRWTFRPDVAILFRNQKLLAIEVKLLRGRGSGDAGAKGLGQATIYATQYEYSCLALYSASRNAAHRLDRETTPWAVLPER